MSSAPHLDHPLTFQLPREISEERLSWARIPGGREERTASRDRVLAALVELDPLAGAKYLLEHADELKAQLREDRIGPLLERVIPDEQIPRGARHDVARSYSGYLSPRAIAGLHAAGVDISHDALLRERVAELLPRTPQDPLLLGIGAEAAIASEAWEDANRLLNALGRASPTASTVRRVRRLRDRIRSAPQPEVRIALLSSFTVDVLGSFVDLECRELGLDPSIYVCPFNKWEQETISDDSGLFRCAAEIVFLAVALDDLIPRLDTDIPAETLELIGSGAVERVVAAVGRIRAMSPATIVVHSLYTDHPSPAGKAAELAPGGRALWIQSLNARLGRGLSDIPGAYLLDVSECRLRRGGGSADTSNLRHLARMRLNDASAASVASAYAHFIAPSKGLTRKCLVLDLDNTLWGGVVGEDGVAGIRIGQESPGSEFVEFQRYLKSLSARGFLLAIASKNNPEDALPILRTHPAMILREEDFAAVRINWLPKPENLVSIAQELNIGVDSLIFLDDNPKERAWMRNALPQVLTPELPADPSRYREILAGLPQIQQLALTSEDQLRAEQYRARKLREQGRNATMNLGEYLRSLGIVVQISELSDTTLPRTQQLFERTNQFNTTARRFALEELRRLSESPDWAVYTLTAKDAYGGHGLVGAAVVEKTSDDWRVENFVLSCRVIGYGVETALLSRIAEDAVRSGIPVLRAEYRRSPKNKPAGDFFAKHGFARFEGDEEGSSWRLELSSGCIPSPSWIRIENEA